jgi:acetoin utilization protein AcuB
MLVKDCMTRHPIMVAPETSASEAQKIMMENKVRHLPVVGDGKKLLGLITRQRLALKPDTLASLNVWEITRYLSNLTVEDIMLKAKEVFTIAPDRTVERAARTMTDHKIGCLPVIEEDLVVGILSEIDLLNSFQQMLALRTDGVRVTVRAPDRAGEGAKTMTEVGQRGWKIMGVGIFYLPKDPDHYHAVYKIEGVTVDEVKAALSNVAGQEIIDIREVV